jgi:23S rRNA pseudouridine2605 synthase
MRIARYLASCGLGARRTCERLVTAGRVAVDGKPVSPESKRYLLLNKPAGFTCSASDAHARHLVHELLPPSPRLFTVGRLDRDSEGLLICTNDGEFANRVAHPRHEVVKTYEVTVSGNVSAEALRRLEQGIPDSGEILQAKLAELLQRTPGASVVRVKLTEGRKREIRRMCAAVGWRVKRLLRVSIGPIEDRTLPSGAWRDLTSIERDALINA